MNLKLVVAISLFAATPTLAQAQKDGPVAAVPKPTVAEAQKVAQTIGGDKTKLQAYCDLGKLQDQMEETNEKDTKTLDALGAKADALAEKIGPDYVKLMDGLDEVDPDSAEGKQFAPVFEALAKQCK
jgi:hypothetical protein